MKNSNHPLRIKALKEYNLNPNFCKICSKKIEIGENQRPRDAKKKKFCSRACSSINSNLGICRYKGIRTSLCSCGNKKSRKAKTCRICLLEKGTINKTLNEIIGGKKYTTTLLNDLRKHGRKVLENSSIEKSCKLCHNEEFKPVLESCHIKGIMTFNLSTKVKDINKIENLIWLCPSHHKLFDKGLVNI